MKTGTVLVLTLLLGSASVASGPNRAQRLPDPMMDSLLTRGIDQILLQEYAQAQLVFRSFSKQFPHHPAGYLYQAACLQAISMDYEELLERAPFDSLLALSAARAEEVIQSTPESPWGFYYLGTTLGYDSYARAERGDWFGAVTKGMSAASNFEKAVAADSGFYDAYVGIGTYYYWKSRKIEFLNWLPFVKDHRAEGIRMLKVCASLGTYNRFAAMSSLVGVLLDAKDHIAAVAVAKEALSVYPENRIFLWGLATAYERSGKVREALASYERLLQAILSDERTNHYNELVARLRLVELRSGQGEDIREDLKELLTLESISFPDHLKEKAAEKFDLARRIQAASARNPGSR